MDRYEKLEWRIKGGVVLLASFGVLFLILYTYKWGEELPHMGNRAPNFSFENLQGGPVTLSSLRGKVVLLNIWATWCGPCKEEMPSMEGLYQHLKGEPFEMVAVSIDKEGAPVKEFVETFKLTFPILLDTQETMMELYQLTGVPESYILNKEGFIVEKIIGPRNWLEYLPFFKKLLGEVV